MRKILLIALFCFLSFAANATSYYISPMGNDSNNGTSSATPWQTLSKASGAAYGSTLLFQGGGTWSGSLAGAVSSSQYLSLNVYNAVPSFVGTVSASGSTLTIISQANGNSGYVGIGSKLSGCTGFPANTYIMALGTGTGTTGTYTINVNLPSPQTLSVSATSCTISGAPPVIVGSGSAQTLNLNGAVGPSINGITFMNAGYEVGDVSATYQGLSGITISNCAFIMTGTNNSAPAFEFGSSGGTLSNITFTNNFVSNSNGYTGLYLNIYSYLASNFTISLNTFYNTGGDGFGMNPGNQTNITTNSLWFSNADINGNYFVNTGTNPNQGGGAALNLRVGLVNGSGQSYIRNNVMYNIGNPLIDYTNAVQCQYCRYVKVFNNTIANVYSTSSDGDGIIIDHAFGTSTYQSYGTEVAYNTVTGTNAFCSGSGYPGGINVYDGSYTTVHSNLVYGNCAGLELYLSSSANNQLYNNTSVGNTLGANIDTGGYSGPPASNWYNNIFANNSSYGMRINLSLGTVSPTENNNLFYNNTGGNINNGSPVTPNSTDVLTNPLFVGSSNYALSFGSPAVNAGARLNNYLYLVTDITGFMSNSPKPDIGAYFYHN